MADDDGPLDRLKREAFGKLADVAKDENVGSGISLTSRMSVDLVAYADGNELNQMAWTENPALIAQLFTPIFQRSRICPGRDKAQCCQAGPGDACFPNWQAREDPEWYALQINKYLSQVNRRLQSVTPITAALAADEAFELGCLLTEALIKFQWDAHAKRGKGTLESAAEGGRSRREANPNRLSVVETVNAVDALIANGVRKMAAYSIVAQQQHVEIRTIRKEYKLHKK